MVGQKEEFGNGEDKRIFRLERREASREWRKLYG
jgi:hypothetical protein